MGSEERGCVLLHSSPVVWVLVHVGDGDYQLSPAVVPFELTAYKMSPS